MNSARCYALSGVMNDRIYVAGGMGSTTSGLLKSVEAYDPEEDRLIPELFYLVLFALFACLDSST
jgi:hypothetical protein